MPWHGVRARYWSRSSASVGVMNYSSTPDWQSDRGERNGQGTHYRSKGLEPVRAINARVPATIRATVRTMANCRQKWLDQLRTSTLDRWAGFSPRQVRWGPPSG